ncbi:hypothetical protein BC629DRAFT_1439050 [Irpex lacteus]|nr:hypothetical protein BC629DRAFT_1439050 [Irpex lacteus]
MTLLIREHANCTRGICEIEEDDIKIVLEWVPGEVFSISSCEERPRRNVPYHLPTMRPTNDTLTSIVNALRRCVVPHVRSCLVRRRQRVMIYCRQLEMTSSSSFIELELRFLERKRESLGSIGVKAQDCMTLIDALETRIVRMVRPTPLLRPTFLTGNARFRHRTQPEDSGTVGSSLVLARVLKSEPESTESRWSRPSRSMYTIYVDSVRPDTDELIRFVKLVLERYANSITHTLPLLADARNASSKDELRHIAYQQGDALATMCDPSSYSALEVVSQAGDAGYRSIVNS